MSVLIVADLSHDQEPTGPFSCRQIVSYISRYITLKAGDVIITGTPEGVILGYPKE